MTKRIQQLKRKVYLLFTMCAVNVELHCVVLGFLNHRTRPCSLGTKRQFFKATFIRDKINGITEKLGMFQYQQDDDEDLYRRRQVGHVVESFLNLSTNNANDNVFIKQQGQQEGGERQKNKMVIQNLFQLTTQRAYSTTQMTSTLMNKDGDFKRDGEDDDDEKKQRQEQEHRHPEIPHYSFPFATRYKFHPALSNVALAQALWSSIIRPNVDTVIDATCGNGYDSVAVAKLLFHNYQNDHPCYAQLICLDVQEQACDNTRRALQETVRNMQQSHEGKEQQDIDCFFNDHVQVLHASHEVLPRPRNDTSVGLVVYNLGWLPNHTDAKDCITTMETTISSITDAVLMLRVGGMLSIVTYPRTGPDEDRAVRLFVTCLALLSSNVRSWQDAIREVLEDDDGDNDGTSSSNEQIARHVQQAMERVIQYGPIGQTWRVSQHDKLGMEQAPILVTATRIK
jgi:hypothetical protein